MGGKNWFDEQWTHPAAAKRNRFEVAPVVLLDQSYLRGRAYTLNETTLLLKQRDHASFSRLVGCDNCGNPRESRRRILLG